MMLASPLVMIDADPVACARLSLVLIIGLIAYLQGRQSPTACWHAINWSNMVGQACTGFARQYLVRVLLVDEADACESGARGQAIASRPAAHAVVRDSQDDHRQHPDLRGNQPRAPRLPASV